MADVWEGASDLDGLDHYRTLRVEPHSSLTEIKNSYRKLARILHPDKGGSTEAFSKLQAAFEVLSDPERRKTYDLCAKQLKYKYIQNKVREYKRDEDVLFKVFESQGIKCDPLTQLVITCEVCGRPSTKECWICSMKICEFCTLKPHWKGVHKVHWPLINSSHMHESLAKREMEQKIKEEARVESLQDPNYRDEDELIFIREFKLAAYDIEYNSNLKLFDYRLARFYMWGQTDKDIVLAVHIPTGYKDKTVYYNISSKSITVQAEDNPPVLERDFDEDFLSQVDPYEIAFQEDQRYYVFAIPKKNENCVIKRLFKDDSDGVRCIKPMYDFIQLDDDCIFEIDVPFWIDTEDVSVEISEDKFEVSIKNNFHIKRCYWKSHPVLEGNLSIKNRKAVITESCSWVLGDVGSKDGKRFRTLTINLALPEASESERMYKKGILQDNRVQQLSRQRRGKGIRFFMEDEDEFELEDFVCAICFCRSGKTWIPVKTWDMDRGGGYYATSKSQLPRAVENLCTKFTNKEFHK